MQVQLNGQSYQTSGKLSAMEQFHVARRLLPVIASLKDLSGLAPTPSGEQDPALLDRALTSIVEAIGRLSDDDCAFVISKCLSRVQRQSGVGWQQVQAPGGAMMFEDIDMLTMLRLVFEVLTENLGSFLAVLPLPSLPGTQPPTA